MSRASTTDCAAKSSQTPPLSGTHSASLPHESPPPQTPAEQTSPLVQASPSSQGSLLKVVSQNPPTQALSVQVSLSLHSESVKHGIAGVAVTVRSSTATSLR